MMIMKRTLHLSLITFHLSLITAALLSCENYLDVQPYGRTIPKTAEEFSALVHSLLDEVDAGSSHMVPGSSSICNWDCGGGDDFEVCLTETSGRTLPVYQGFNVSNYGIEYSKCYEYIRDCNIVIDNMTEEDTQLSNNVRAAAYAMRAVSYLQLLRLYCEAPVRGAMDEQLGVALVTKFDMEERPVRSTMQQVVDLIESDLKRSIELHVTDGLYRFTEDVCKGYLARLYFWTEQWDKALPLCDELLKAHPLLAGADFKKMMDEPFAISGNELLKAHRQNTTSSYNQYSLTLAVMTYRPVSTRFLSCFAAGEDTTDIRYTMYVNRLRKTRKNLFAGMRAAEFQLIKAEAHYHLGQDQQALDALNDLRSHRITPYKPLTLQTLPPQNATELIKQDCEGHALTPLLSAILRERRKELFLEGDRLFELKRNGTPEFWTAYNGRKYTTLPYMYTWPIPESEIRINPAVRQNPGYTELISN